MAYKILEEKWRPEGVIRDILIDSTDDIPNLPAGSLPASGEKAERGIFS